MHRRHKHELTKEDVYNFPESTPQSYVRYLEERRKEFNRQTIREFLWIGFCGFVVFPIGFSLFILVVLLLRQL